MQGLAVWHADALMMLMKFAHTGLHICHACCQRLDSCLVEQGKKHGYVQDTEMIALHQAGCGALHDDCDGGGGVANAAQ